MEHMMVHGVQSNGNKSQIKVRIGKPSSCKCDVEISRYMLGRDEREGVCAQWRKIGDCGVDLATNVNIA
jgi:hypothetical protein